MYQANPRKIMPAPVAAANERQQDGVEYCLQCWQTWMHWDDRDLGMQRWRGYEDAADAELRHINEVAAATDAMMKSLNQRHQWALRKKMGLARVWNYPHADLASSYVEAIEQLEIFLRKNLATRNLFS